MYNSVRTRLNRERPISSHQNPSFTITSLLFTFIHICRLFLFLCNKEFAYWIYTYIIPYTSINSNFVRHNKIKKRKSRLCPCIMYSGMRINIWPPLSKTNCAPVGVNLVFSPPPHQFLGNATDIRLCPSILAKLARDELLSPKNMLL